jgi:hypothetical protein
VRLGNPNGAEALTRAGKGGAPLRAAVARNTDRHARGLGAGGRGHPRRRSNELRAIATELMLTHRGGRWHVSTVLNLLDSSGCAAPATGFLTANHWTAQTQSTCSGITSARFSGVSRRSACSYSTSPAAGDPFAPSSEYRSLRIRTQEKQYC